MDDMRLHDPFLLTRYAVQNELTKTKEWEWTSSYMVSDRTFPKLDHAYKVSTFMKTMKFGVEVPQTTKQAFTMDEAESNHLWSQAMEAAIKSLHAHNTF